MTAVTGDELSTAATLVEWIEGAGDLLSSVDELLAFVDDSARLVTFTRGALTLLVEASIGLQSAVFGYVRGQLLFCTIMRASPGAMLICLFGGPGLPAACVNAYLRAKARARV